MQFLKGLAATLRVVEREIEFDGVMEKFNFRKLSSLEVDEINSSLEKDGEGNLVRASVVKSFPKWIAACLCDESGASVATDEEIAQLPMALVNKFSEVVNEVNGFTAKKSSAETSGSGTSSPPDSEEPSRA